MAKKPLTRDSQFIVGEERVLNYVITGIFLAVFILGCFDIKSLGIALVLPLGLAVFYFIKARSKKIFIRINIRGIYQDEKLVTGWDHFIKATLSQKPQVLDIRDNFVLIVDYRKEGIMGGQRRTIPLTNTQNQSEEDVLAAVKFFLHEYRDKAAVEN
ncbi:MAG TPA: hypothetical protein VGO58_00485 [Chitinophagaceae bacterium]|jgi:hypothetical protein|nr:hypothetical protein [Chitinophagaceae bacterium]